MSEHKYFTQTQEMYMYYTHCQGWYVYDKLVFTSFYHHAKKNQNKPVLEQFKAHKMP